MGMIVCPTFHLKGESMRPRHWMQIAALASALGLAGTTVAIDTDATPSTGDRSSASSPVVETPSAGAIVTPEDKAMGLGKGSSNDEASSINPGRADMDDTSPRYGTPASPGGMDGDIALPQDESQPAPARTGSDVRPGDMGPANVRGE
jgi:hypothetical protein